MGRWSMRVSLSITQNTLKTNCKALTDKLDECSRQIETIGNAFQTEQLQGASWDAVREHAKNLRVPALEAHYSALEDFAESCKQDLDAVCELPQSSPDVCDTDEFQQQINDFTQQIEEANAHIQRLNRELEDFFGSYSLVPVDAIDVKDSLEALVSHAEFAIAELKKKLQIAIEYNNNSVSFYQCSAEFTTLLSNVDISVANYLSSGTIDTSTWKSSADEHFSTAFARRVSQEKAKIVNEDGSNFNEEYVKYQMSRTDLTLEECEALRQVYDFAIKAQIAFNKEMMTPEAAEILDKFNNAGYNFRSERRERKGDSNSDHYPHGYEVDHSYYVMTFSMKPGFKKLCNYILGCPASEADGNDATKMKRDIAMRCIAAGLLDRGTLTKVSQDFSDRFVIKTDLLRTYSGNAVSSKDDPAEERIFGRVKFLTRYDFPDDFDHFSFTYRKDASSNAAEAAQLMGTEMVTSDCMFIAGEAKSIITSLVPIPIPGNVISAFSAPYRLKEHSEHNAKIIHMNEATDVSKTFTSHFVKNGGVVVTSDNRVIPIGVQTPEEAAADKKATEQFHKVCEEGKKNGGGEQTVTHQHWIFEDKEQRNIFEETESNRQYWLSNDGECCVTNENGTKTFLSAKNFKIAEMPNAIYVTDEVTNIGESAH